MEEELFECPNEEHEKELHFNPSTEGPYGPIDCEWCNGEGYVTEEVYEEYYAYWRAIEEARRKRREQSEYEKAVQKTFDRIKYSKGNVIDNNHKDMI